MSEEMKLLMALCDALGFEVERTLDSKERKEPAESAKIINTNYARTDRQLLSVNGELVIDNNKMYTSYLREPETSYKLTKAMQFDPPSPDQMRGKV